MVGKLLLYPLQVGIWLINLVDGNHNGHASGTRVSQGLQGLRHYPIIGSDHQDGNIGYLSPVCPHRGKGFVPRGVEEGYRLSMDIYLIGADMLGDLACLGGGHIGLTYGIEEAGFTVVYMPHYGDYGGSGLFHTGIVLQKLPILLQFLA